MNFKYWAALSLILNVVFGIKFFGLAPDQLAQTANRPQDATLVAAVSPAVDHQLKIDLSTNKTLQNYHTSLLRQGFSTDQTKPLIYAVLKTQHIDSIPRPDDKFWRHQPLAQITYMEALSKGYKSVRGGLVGIYGPRVSEDPLLTDMFYPMVNQYPFLSSEDQIAVQEMQLGLQRYSVELQSQGGMPQPMPPERSPQQLLANLLGGNATKEYMLRTSPLANKMRQSGVTFTEEKFRKAYDVLGQLKSIQSTGETFDARDQINEIFGSNEGLILWAAVDPIYGVIKQVANKHEIAEGIALSAYELILTVKQEVSQAAEQRESDPKQTMYMVQSLIAELKNELSQLVGEPAANDFINTLSGRRPPSSSRRSNG